MSNEPDSARNASGEDASLQRSIRARTDFGRSSRLAQIVPPSAAAALLAGAVVAHVSAPAAAIEVPAVKDSGYWIEEVTTGIEWPWAFAWLPNGDMLITERRGRLRIIRDGKLLPDPIAGTPKVVSGPYDGLLDVKLDPDFAQNKTIYLGFTEPQGEGEGDLRHAAIFKARLDGNRLVDGKVIFRSGPAQMMGPPTALRMLFLPDKTLIMGVGSAQATMAQAASMGTDIAKIIRIDRDGGIPADNPFLKTPGARPELWAVGVRNLSGLIRANDGEIWATDIGPKGADELNRLKAGGDFGWPRVTWGFEYDGGALSKQQESKETIAPIAMWSPSHAPSGLAQYTGTTFPQWNGDFFIGGLVGQSIIRVRVADGKWVEQERMAYQLGERIRSIEVGPDNLIYFISDSGRGRLFRFRPGKPKPSERARVAGKLPPAPKLTAADIAAMGQYRMKPDVANGQREFGERCSGCHKAGPFTVGDAGPDLNGVNGRPAGSLPGYSYSAAFHNPDAQRPWTTLGISYFIANPQGLFPGTTMSSDPVTDGKVRLDISTFLAGTKAPVAK